VGRRSDRRNPLFISGIPLWGTLVRSDREGKGGGRDHGAAFTSELFYASGGRAWHERSGERRRLATSGRTALAEATLCTTTPAMFSGERRAAYDRVEKSVRMARYGTDCYAYAMVAAGHVDLVIETGLQPYDIIALIPIIEAAGGTITGWEGGPAERGGDIVAAATPELHAAALAVLGRTEAATA